jgi:hypothetical protein
VTLFVANERNVHNTNLRDVAVAFDTESLKNDEISFFMYEWNTSVSQMKTLILNIFYLVIYWTQKVHNDFIFLRSLHYVPYKCSST